MVMLVRKNGIVLKPDVFLQFTRQPFHHEIIGEWGDGQYQTCGTRQMEAQGATSKGFADKEIALQMFVTLKCVKFHCVIFIARPY